tara:strand:+ start:4697 stop:7462 length:2766 start_codon:yes stop_codon:yes gene_type:complete
MSIQLIIFPQSYNGQYNVVSVGTTNNLIADGQTFTTINSAPTGTFADFTWAPIVATFIASPTNQWEPFRTNNGGAVTGPVMAGGDLVLSSLNTAINGGSGVFQKVTGLSVGTNYKLIVTQSAVGVGMVGLDALDGFAVVGTLSDSAANLTHTLHFTATNTQMNMIITFGASSTTTCVIDTITLTLQAVIPTFTTNELNDGQVILDLYEDENIPLTLSIDDFKNAAEKVQSYSKSFKVPGTKRNNKIFDNAFSINRADDGVIFNPYVRTQSLLKQDGFTLFEGYLRLIDVTEKNGEVSYNVNLYSEVVALADVLKDLTLSDLDFTELEHNYNKTEIKRSWNDFPAAGITYLAANTSGFRDDNTTVKYPFVDWDHQMTIANGSGHPSATLGLPELTAFEQAFRPFINVKYLIDRIFTQPLSGGVPPAPFPFTYTSDLFNTDDFKKLYMDFNWGDEEAPVVFDNTDTSGVSLAVYVSGSANAPQKFPGITQTSLGYDNSTGKFTSSYDNQYYQVNVTVEYEAFLGATAMNAEWVHTTAAGVETIYNPQSSGAMADLDIFTYFSSFALTGVNALNQNDTLNMRLNVTGANPIKVNTQLTSPTPLTIATGVTQTTNETLLQTVRGELGQWDFLKGIMTMFNLVSLPDKSNPTNIIIEPYSDIFINHPAGTNLASRGIAHDWTDKIDITEMKLKPLTELDKKTVFKFVEDDDDYPFQNYKNLVGGHLYGSKVWDASGFTILQGDEEIVAEPFAATVIKPYIAQFPELITPALYSYNPDDGTSAGFENSPRIMYNNGKIDLTAMTYFIPSQNNTTGENATQFLQFSHLSAIPPVAGTTVDFHFGACQLIPPIGDSVSDNLFNTYWLPYFAELYHPDTRSMKLKVNLKPGDISKFNMYDTVMLINRQFRVNKIDYKPNDLATVEFILVP